MKDLLLNLPPDNLAQLERVDRLWSNLRLGNINPQAIVNSITNTLPTVDFDVAIAGGTLGIILAAALQQQGIKTIVIERGKLQGRVQEWNISRSELEVLIELELLSASELATAIVTEYNPARIALPQMPDIWVKDVLNIGIDPVYLLATLKQKFLDWGGQLLEYTSCDRVNIHPNGVEIRAGEGIVTTRLFIDAMGHFSPVAAQARGQVKPEGICLVVGSCGTGFDRNDSGDILAAFTSIQNQCQYFWEAFPARDGRTTYLFTYLDADPDRFSLQFLMGEYLRLLPEYQQIELEQIKFDRFLSGCFPSYRRSPLHPGWDRVLLVGDSSGAQSPVSFGGFGAMLLNLARLTAGIREAIEIDALSSGDLNLLQPQRPNISVTWMFQRSMSARIGQKVDPELINRLLAAVFTAMSELGDDVLRPFLQDVVKFRGLSRTLFKTSITAPLAVIPIVPHVGIPMLLSWSIDYLRLGGYTGLSQIGQFLEPHLSRLNPHQQYYLRQTIRAWQYGSGCE
jgi:lycopene cyclase CruP